MTCGSRLARLPCDRLGAVTVGAKYSGGPTLTLKPGSAAALPTLQNDEVMFLEVLGAQCGGCAVFRVTAVTGEALTVDPVSDVCLPAGTTLRYTATAPDAIKLLAAELPVNAQPPLYWDCDTRTMRLDCAELKAMVNTPCGG